MKKVYVTKKTEESIKDWLQILRDLIFALDNPNRRIILEMCNEKPYKIKEIRDYLKSSNKVILDHLRILKTNALIKTEKKKKERGQPVYVKSNFGLDDAIINLRIVAKMAEEEYFKIKNKIK